MRRKSSLALLVSLLLLSATTAAWSQTFTTLLQLTPSRGAYPLMGVIPDNSGNLYGLGWASGNYFSGSVFQVTNSGGTWTQTDLYDFLPSAGDDLTGNPSS